MLHMIYEFLKKPKMIFGSLIRREEQQQQEKYKSRHDLLHKEGIGSRISTSSSSAVVVIQKATQLFRFATQNSSTYRGSRESNALTYARKV
jgi:hypothetical protein